MSVSKRHLLQQGPVISAFLRTAAVALRSSGGGPALATPTPELRSTVKPRPNKLIDDYIRHCGGRPSWYRGVVPAHLFSQWGFPLLSQTLSGIPYDMKKVLNGGCRIEIHQPLPRGEALQLSACLEEIDDNGRRAVLRQKLVTGTASAPEAVSCWMYAIVPLKRDKSKGDRPKRERPRVPTDAREIDRWRLNRASAVDFSTLTGDFNPVHWVKPYANAAGFKNIILQGFATLGRSVETLNEAVFAQNPGRLAVVDVKFTRPLVLPRKVGVYLGPGDSFAVGVAPGGPAYLTGTFETH